MNDDGAAERPMSAAQQWTAWELEVLADGSEVAPLEIEEATVGNGWPWCSWRVSGADLVKLDGARWEWATACAWGASFTRAKAAESVAAFGKWRGREWRNGIGRAVEGRSPKMVEAELRNALEAGTMKAWAFQESRPVTIPAAEWPALEWRRDEHGETLEFDDLLLFGEPRYRRVTISRAEVMRLWLARDGWAPVEVAADDPPGPVDDAPMMGAVEDLATTAEAPIDVDFHPVVEEPLAPEAPFLAPPPTRQERLSAIVREMPAGLRWEASDPARKPGGPVNYEFHRELERAFGGDVSRDREARPAWQHYPHKPKRGRPRRSPKK